MGRAAAPLVYHTLSEPRERPRAGVLIPVWRPRGLHRGALPHALVVLRQTVVCLEVKAEADNIRQRGKERNVREGYLAPGEEEPLPSDNVLLPQSELLVHRLDLYGCTHGRKERAVGW